MTTPWVLPPFALNNYATTSEDNRRALRAKRNRRLHKHWKTAMPDYEQLVLATLARKDYKPLKA
jgi:hypothetical protein